MDRTVLLLRKGAHQAYLRGEVTICKELEDAADCLQESPTVLNSYQEKALVFHSDREDRLLTYLLGLAGEAGEVCDLFKKHIGHGHPLERDKVVKELGDVLWYLSAIASLQGISLQEVADTNIAKLTKRYPKGFSSEASINREEYKTGGSD